MSELDVRWLEPYFKKYPSSDEINSIVSDVNDLFSSYQCSNDMYEAMQLLIMGYFADSNIMDGIYTKDEPVLLKNLRTTCGNTNYMGKLRLLEKKQITEFEFSKPYSLMHEDKKITL